MQPGVGQGGLQPLVAQQGLNAGNLTTRIDQLRGERVPEHMGRYFHSRPFSRRLEPKAYQFCGNMFVAVEENVVIYAAYAFAPDSEVIFHRFDRRRLLGAGLLNLSCGRRLAAPLF